MEHCLHTACYILTQGHAGLKRAGARKKKASLRKLVYLFREMVPQFAGTIASETTQGHVVLLRPPIGSQSVRKNKSKIANVTV